MAHLGRILRPALFAAALAMPVVLGAGPASAHDQFVGADPAPGSTLTTAPVQVVVHFEEPPGHLGYALVVTDPVGASVTSGEPTLSASDLAVGLAPLVHDGVYTVAYRIVADDGHPLTGSFTWTLAGSAAAATSASATASASATSSASSASGSSATVTSGPLGLWVAAGLAVVVAAGAAVVVRRRR